MKRRRSKRKNPQGVRLPRRVVHLGRCIELNFEDGEQWKPPRTAQLCCSESGSTLWILTVSGRARSSEIRSPLYEKFTGYFVSGVRTAKVREPVSLERGGRVASIVYESDKWDSKKREYIHEFRMLPRAYTDNFNKPSFVKISGGNIRVQSRGITG